MAFTEDVIRNAFEKVNGYCQICGKKLVYNNRGSTEGRGGWEAEHIKPVSEGGNDTIRNCMILCMECYNDPVKSAGPVAGSKPSGRKEGLHFGERQE